MTPDVTTPPAGPPAPKAQNHWLTPNLFWLAVVLVFIFGPLLPVYAVNTLLERSVAYDVYSWVAGAWVNLVLSALAGTWRKQR